LVGLALGFAAVGTPGAAQERSLNFAVRGGVAVAPSYPGADSYEAGPGLSLQFGALRWGKLKIGSGIGAEPKNGVRLRPVFRVLGDRRAADNPELAGLSDIDAALELGFGVHVQQTHWRAFSEVRKGVTGHRGVTGSIGADAIFRPNARLQITMGPRMSFGDSEFAQTYFGVSTATANFVPFEASGGALGAGFQINARYELNDDWALDGALGYQKLVGDAQNSPITQAGSEDQWTLRFGLSRAFTLRF
jgi:outer membrane protein